MERIAGAIRKCVVDNDFSDHELYCMNEKGYEYVALAMAKAVFAEVPEGFCGESR
jgi:hypothetical protein